MMNLNLLRKLALVRSPSGEEWAMKDFILDFVQKNKHKWKSEPVVVAGDHIQECVILIFGQPRCAAFAHMDTTGFTVRYQDQLVPTGSPEVEGGELLIGQDDLGEIECRLTLDQDGFARYVFGRGIITGTSLVYKPYFKQEDDTIMMPYLDNRIGVFALLSIAPVLEHGALVFSCWEEHGGGSVPFLVKYLYENWSISRMLVSDVTWVTDGVMAGDGVVISHRDRSIPRQPFIRRIIRLAEEHKIPFQKEVEAHGSSDGREIQASPYPIDWCFVGAPVANIHSDGEIIHKNDLEAMIRFYEVLFRSL